MQGIDSNHPLELDPPADDLPAYAPPTVTTYTDEQLLEALGPAQAMAYGPNQARRVPAHSILSGRMKGI